MKSFYNDIVRLAKASSLIRRHEDEIAEAVYCWIGMDHALTYALLDHVADRARSVAIENLAKGGEPRGRGSQRAVVRVRPVMFA